MFSRRVFRLFLWMVLCMFLVFSPSVNAAGADAPEQEFPAAAILSSPDIRTSWDFRLGLQDWQLQNNLSFDSTDPQLGTVLIVTGLDPWLVGPEMAGVLARDYPYLYIRMASQTDNCGQVYFKRLGDTDFDASRGINLPIVADGNPQHLLIDMRQNPHWNGTIRQLRIDPACNQNYLNGVRMEYVALVGNFAGWNFDLDSHLIGWMLNNKLANPSFSYPQGAVMQVVGNDPWMESPYLRLTAEDHPYLYVQMASQTDNCAEFYFRKAGQPNFTAQQAFSVPLVADGGTKHILIDLRANPHWSGEIEQIRFDPACNMNNVNFVRVDKIALLGKRTGWDFSKGLQGWYIKSGLSEPGLSAGSSGTVFRVIANDPFIISPYLYAPAAQYPFIHLRLESVTDGCGQIYFQRLGDTDFDDSRRFDLVFQANATIQNLVFDTRQHPNWNGVITRLRIDPACQLAGDYYVRVDQLNLIPNLYLPVVRK